MRNSRTNSTKKDLKSFRIPCRSQGSSRRLYDVLIERVFRDEEKKNDARVGKADIDALEKEISIDVADLRRDIRNLRRDLKYGPKIKMRISCYVVACHLYSNVAFDAPAATSCRFLPLSESCCCCCCSLCCCYFL